jgi:hypothetical protein
MRIIFTVFAALMLSACGLQQAITDPQPIAQNNTDCAYYRMEGKRVVQLCGEPKMAEYWRFNERDPGQGGRGGE